MVMAQRAIAIGIYRDHNQCLLSNSSSMITIVTLRSIFVIDFAAALFGLYVEEDTFEGQGLVEYALIIAFIAVVVIVAMVFLRGKITTLCSKVGNSLT